MVHSFILQICKWWWWTWECPTPRKKGAEIVLGDCPGNMSGGTCGGWNVRIAYSNCSRSIGERSAAHTRRAASAEDKVY